MHNQSHICCMKTKEGMTKILEIGADGEPKVVAKSGQTAGAEGSLGGGYITKENVVGKSGKYKYEGLSGLVAQKHYNYIQEYTWEQMWEILKKRGLAKNTIATYKRNLEKNKKFGKPRDRRTNISSYTNLESPRVRHRNNPQGV